MLRTLLLAVVGLAGFGVFGAAAQESECLAYRVATADFGQRGIEVAQGLATIVEVLERRTSDLGTPAPTAAILGEDVVVVRLPAGSNLADLRDDLARPGEFSIHVVERTFPTSDLAVMLIGPDRIALPSAELPGTSFLMHTASVVSGTAIAEAKAELDAVTGQPLVTFLLEKGAREAFGEATKANIGAQLAIVVDGIVLAAPTVRETITSGRGQISGAFTLESANELALLLRSGALPARLVLLGEGAAACIP